MSFTCGIHGWRHGQSPCPICKEASKASAPQAQPRTFRFTAEDFYFDVETLGRGVSSADMMKRANALLEAEENKANPFEEFYFFMRNHHGHISFEETVGCNICEAMEQTKNALYHAERPVEKIGEEK